jgi:6-phosphofructokinase 1
MTERRLGILVGGGPAPGINSALSAAAIAAIQAGLPVVGILDGFEHLIKERTNMVRPLPIGDVTRIHHQGGSIIRTSRANPTRSAEDLDRTVETLRKLEVTHLVTIGGEDTASAAAGVSRHSGDIRVAHIPKTIDNDLPLPANAPTFGFETARHVGTHSVLSLIEESRTTNRWCIVVVMGRKAGHLALGMGKAAGATLTIIPEEFAAQQITIGDVCTILEGAMLKRRAVQDRKDGVAVVAEGVSAKMSPEHLRSLPGVEVGYDPHGNIRLEKVPLAAILEREVVRRFAERGVSLTVVPVTLGYELRCAPPIPFDIDYTRTLGYGAVEFLLSETGERYRDGGVVCLESGRLNVIPFDELQDPDTGRISTRMVDITSEHYRVAREYMLRLNRSDLENSGTLAALADTANVEPSAFKQQFASAVSDLGAIR